MSLITNDSWQKSIHDLDFSESREVGPGTRGSGTKATYDKK